MSGAPPAPRSALRTRSAVVAREATAFGVVGALCLVVDLGLYNLLSLVVGLGPLTSKGLSAAVATTLSYALNRRWSFRHRAGDVARVPREFTVFLLLNGAALVLSWLTLGTGYYLLDQRSALAQNVAAVVGIGLGTVFRFVTYRRWVFRG